MSFITIVAVFALYSCNEVDYDSKKQVIQDSMLNVFPRWQALKLELGDNNTTMLIVMGDATFYNAPQEEKNKKAEELGQMILRILGKGNYLEKGKLIVTADIHNSSETPPDGILFPLTLPRSKKLLAGNRLFLNNTQETGIFIRLYR